MAEDFFRENKWAIWLIAVSLAIIAVVSYFVFKAPRPPVTPNVTVSIDAPQQSASGKEVVYTVHFANNDNSQATNVTMDMIYPSGFTFEDSTPKPGKLTGELFNIPDMSPGQSSVLMIKGTLTGNAGEVKSVSAVMHYKFSNFNSDFVARATSQTQIINSNIVIQFGGPLSINDNQTITYTISYTNTSTNTLSGLHLKVTLPANFALSSYNPQTTNQNEWDLQPLGPNQNGSVQVIGRFSNANVGDQEIFAAEVDGPDSSGSGQYIAYSNGTYQVSIIPVPLEADLAVTDNNNPSATDTIQPGDSLTFKVNYKNNDTIPMSGVSINVPLSGSAFDLSSVQVGNGTVSNNTVVWDASGVSDLNSLQPQQNGQLVFTARIKNPATKSNIKNLSISAHTEIKSAEITQPFIGPNVSFKIATVAQIATGLAFNSGANPPKVGQQTGYLVLITLHNTTNDLTGSTVTFNLPHANGFDLSSVNGETVTYDQNTKKVTWKVGTLSAHTGDFNAIRKLQFTTFVNPSPADANTAMTIANNIVFNGTDGFTNNSVSLSAPDITTSADPSGNGIVVQ